MENHGRSGARDMPIMQGAWDAPGTTVMHDFSDLRQGTGICDTDLRRVETSTGTPAWWLPLHSRRKRVASWSEMRQAGPISEAMADLAMIAFGRSQ